MTRPARQLRGGGFTLVEVMVALTVMAIGLLGVMSLHLGATSASGYSRRATEAAILAEDKLEQLRTLPASASVDGSDQVDSGGVLSDDGRFERTWGITWAEELATITVAVSWFESDGAHTITFRSMRTW